MKKINFKGVASYFLVLVIFAGFLFLVYSIDGSPLTGFAVFNLNAREVDGSVAGSLSFSMKGGEFIPADSLLSISSNGETKEYQLREFVEGESVSGDYYLEGESLSGSGEGYGVAGEKILGEEVNFVLRVVSSGESSGSSDEGSSSGSSSDSGEESGNESNSGSNSSENAESVTGEVLNEEVVSEDNSDNGDESEDSNVDGSDVSESGASETTESSGESETSSESQEVSETSDSSENAGEGESLSGGSEESSSGAEGESGEGSSESSSENSGSDSGVEKAIAGGVALTGQAVSNLKGKENLINGKVAKGEVYEYSLKDGESVELVSSSQDVNINVENGIVKVTTDYGEVERGFGEEYLSDEDYNLNIDLSEMNLSSGGGVVDVALYFGDEEIFYLSEDLSEVEEIIDEVEGGVGGLVNESLNNKSLGNLTESNVSLNVSADNESLSNLSESNVSVNVSLERDYTLSEDEIELLFVNTGSRSVTISETEVINERLIVRFEVGDYWLESSYDSSIGENELDELIELDRARWVKILVKKFAEADEEIEESEVGEKYVGEYELG